MTMTRTTKLLTAALAVITLGLGSIAMAQPPEGGGGRRGGHGFGRGFGPGGPVDRRLAFLCASSA